MISTKASSFVKEIISEAIVPINDAKLEYINCIIEEEKQKIQTGGPSLMLEKLESARLILNDEVISFHSVIVFLIELVDRFRFLLKKTKLLATFAGKS